MTIMGSILLLRVGSSNTGPPYMWDFTVKKMFCLILGQVYFLLPYSNINFISLIKLVLNRLC